MAMRGFDLVSATAFLAEIGDLSRFQTPRELIAYLGLVPSEESTGATIRRGPITKAGNRRARRILVECSWSYQHQSVRSEIALGNRVRSVLANTRHIQRNRGRRWIARSSPVSPAMTATWRTR
jgi:transposase